MMGLAFGLFTQVSGSGPLGPLVYLYDSKAFKPLFGMSHNKTDKPKYLMIMEPCNIGHCGYARVSNRHHLASAKAC